MHFNAEKTTKKGIFIHTLMTVYIVCIFFGIKNLFFLKKFLIFTFLTCIRFFVEARWALSSAGRASRLHREGREFEPLSAHQLKPPAMVAFLIIAREVRTTEGSRRKENNLKMLFSDDGRSERGEPASVSDAQQARERVPEVQLAIAKL